MRKEEFCEIFGDINEKYIEEARTHQKNKKSGWLKWGAMAACLAIVVAIGTLIPRQTDDPMPSDQGSEVIIETSYLNIYYLSKNGTIESKSVEVRNTAEDIFNEWAALNNISDVTFVKCVYDNGGTETIKGDTIEHTTGNYFTLTLTLSAGFSMYSESENGELLIKTLRQTFYDYSYFDEFNLMTE